jgi:hypothetical protein
MDSEAEVFEKKRFMIVSYWLQPNGSWDEITQFKDRIKKQDLYQARVILDLKNKKVVKNSINRDANFEDMIDFYKRLIGDQLTPHL